MVVPRRARDGSTLLRFHRVKRLTLALLCVTASLPAAAQDAGYGPLALTLPASTRMLAMGDIGVAGRDDDVIFYNPAQLAVARGTSFSLARLSETARGGALSNVLRVGPGAIGFGVDYLEYQLTPASYPITKGDILARNADLGTSAVGVIGYAQSWKGYRLGAAAKYAMDAIDLERFGQVYGDAGIAHDYFRGRYTAALSVQHIGGSLTRGADRIKPPTMATFGVATARQLGPLDGAATAGVSYSAQDDVTAGGGLELAWSWITGYSVAVRGGAHQARQDGDAEIMGGFGFTADRVTLDVAVQRLPGNRAGYQAGVRIR
jgi:hypothetical protein